MAFEKFYGRGEMFDGWRCLVCGEIVDPVILLHRLTNSPDIHIPEKEGDLLALIKKNLGPKMDAGSVKKIMQMLKPVMEGAS